MTDTQTSTKRAEANRRNAKRSTGPRTPVGKARSRFNALKHGLRAATPILPGEDEGAFDSRLETWTASLGPRDEVEHFLVRRAVQLSWQLERADRAIAAQAIAARIDHDERLAARADEVADLGHRLFWDARGPMALYPHSREDSHRVGGPISWAGEIDDPDDPARLVILLEATALGCAWMLDRWAELRELLDNGLSWAPPDRFKAVRLLGRQPLDAWEDGRVQAIYLASGAMGPAGVDDFADLSTELYAKGWEQYLERLGGRALDRLRPADAAAGKAVLLERIAAEESRLEDLLSGHLEREGAVGEDLSFDRSDAGERLRRYQATCDRTLLRVLETLRKRRRDAEGPKSSARRGPRGVESPEASGGREPAVFSVASEAQQPAVSSVGNNAHQPAVSSVASDAHQPAVSSPSPETPDSGLTPAAHLAEEAPNAPTASGSAPATNEAKPPPAPPIPSPTETPRSPTNEANGRGSVIPRTMGGPMAVLILIAWLCCAGLAATVAGPRNPINPDPHTPRFAKPLSSLPGPAPRRDRE